MPIAYHALLRLLACLGGAVLGLYTGLGLYTLLCLLLSNVCGIDPDGPGAEVPVSLFMIVSCFGAAFVWIKLFNRFVVRDVPARCRVCGGRSYPYRGPEVGRQVAYRCEMCRTVDRL
jgi:hypothetical protein